jgi:DNA-binding response OmpR family regulator
MTVIGESEIYLDCQTLRAGTASVYLTGRECITMSMLLSNQGLGCSIDMLAAAMNHELSLKAKSVVNTHISNLRKKISLLSEGKLAIVWNDDKNRYHLVYK